MLHVVSVSGGKDSTATYCRAIERGLPFRAVAADTGNEHPVTYDAVNTLHIKTGGPQVEWVKADFTRQIKGKRRFIEAKWEGHGVPADLVARALDVLHPTGNPFLDLCLWKGRFPSRKAQFCTFELKVKPINDNVTLPLLRKAATVISWQGVRAAESEVRRYLKPLQRLAGEYDDLPGKLYAYRPLLRVTSVEEIFAIGRRHGVEPNPLYGWGLKRVGCFPCINCSKAELALVDSHFPEQIERLVEWERLVSDAAKRGFMSFFTLVNDPVMSEEWAIFKAAGGKLAAGQDSDIVEQFGVRRMVEWAKTDRGGRQYSLLARDINTVCDQWGACE